MMVRRLNKALANAMAVYVRQHPFLVLHNVMALTLFMLVATWKVVLIAFAANMPNEIFLHEPMSMSLARAVFVLTSIEFSRRYANARGWSDPAVYGPLVAAAFFAPSGLVHDSAMSLVLAVVTVVATIVWTIDMRRG